MTTDGWLVLAILGLAVAAFASDRFRVDGVAMAVLLALGVTGLVTPAEAVAGFSDSAVLMVGGLFVVGEALVATGVATRLGNWLAHVGRGSEVRLTALLMVVVASVGAFMSSTGIVAMFIPVVLGIVAATGFSRGRLMMPLSVAALISGLMTVIATAPNLVVSAALADRGFAPFGFFELTPIGLAILVVAVTYMVTVGRWLLDRPEPATTGAAVSIDALLAGYGLAGRFRVYRITARSNLIGRTIGEAEVRTRHGVTLAAIIRRRGNRLGAQPAVADTVMRTGDLIAVTADAAVVERFAAIEALAEEPMDDRLRAAAREDIGVAEVMLAPDSPLNGKTLREARFRDRRGLTVLAVKHRGELVPGDLTNVPLSFGDLILVAGGWPDIVRLAADPGEFVVLRLPDELKSVAPARSKAPVAVGIVAAMSLAMTFGVLPNAIAVLLAAVAVVATGCVPAPTAYRSVGWSTLVLIAGMLPLATALDKTGVTAELAGGLTTILADVGPYAMLAVLFVITSLVGMFISNTATAVLLAPVAITAAESLGVSAHAFAITVAIASSCAFVTPVSSPVNTLVLEPGRYRFSDYVKVGLPLLVLSLIVTVTMVGILYPIDYALPTGG
jgi:di/tricarboxylate transporter